jgi:hypothetical protein
VRFVPSCTSHKEGKVGLSNAYFMLVPPTQRIGSTWQNQNLCSSNWYTLGYRLVTNITRNMNTTICMFWNDSSFVVIFNVFCNAKQQLFDFKG